MQLNLRWKEDLSDSLTQAVAHFERRLQLHEVSTSMEEVDESVKKGSLRVRRCLHIEIKGIIKKTNEPFHFKGAIFISPLAQK